MDARIRAVAACLVIVVLVTGCAGPGHQVIDQSGDIFVTGGGDTLRFVKKAAPEYPPAVRDAKLQGIVQVEFIVRADGTVAELLVVRSANPTLDQLAVAAIAQWRFAPYSPRHGVPEKIQVPITFALD